MAQMRKKLRLSHLMTVTDTQTIMGKVMCWTIAPAIIENFSVESTCVQYCLRSWLTERNQMTDFAVEFWYDNR